MKRPGRRRAVDNPNANFLRSVAEHPAAGNRNIDPLPGENGRIPTERSSQQFHLVSQLPQIVGAALRPTPLPRRLWRSHKNRELQIVGQTFIDADHPGFGRGNCDARLAEPFQDLIKAQKCLALFRSIVDVWPVPHEASVLILAAVVAEQETRLVQRRRSEFARPEINELLEPLIPQLLGIRQVVFVVEELHSAFVAMLKLHSLTIPRRAQAFLALSGLPHDTAASPMFERRAALLR